MPSLIERALRRAVGRDGAIGVFVPHQLAEALEHGPVPLAPGPPADPGRLEVAFVVPSFRRVSGGHTSIASVIRALEARGHACSVRIVDDHGGGSTGRGAELERDFQAWFGPVAGPVRAGLDGWGGADVVVATAWQTVPAVLRLPGARARAYYVQDHEPDFYGLSAERSWAEWTYRHGLHCIAGSPWLVDTLRERYGETATLAEFGFDHDVYRPQPVERRRDLVLHYARPATGRRGTALGVLALRELKRRRPGVEIAIFGEARPMRTGFAYTNLGVLGARNLARTYGEATVGMVLSLTNPSLMPMEMAACGLPCVDVDAANTRRSYESELGVTLVQPTPAALCGALERALDGDAAAGDPSRFTWAAAADGFEAGLRAALAR